MSNFSGYKTKSFSETQKFFVLDPNTGSPSFVNGSDLVAQITPNSNYVYAESTRTTAQSTDYPVGSLVQTSGDIESGDGLGFPYLVVPGGDGDYVMDNGNELLALGGEGTLRADLASSQAGKGADLVYYEGATSGLSADSVQAAIDQIASGGVSAASPLVFVSGPGTTDDTAAFQAAIDELPADGGFIFLEAGDYTVTASSLVVGTKTVVWWGDGAVNGSVNFNSLPGMTLGINRNSVADPTGQIVLYRIDPNENYGPAARIRTLADYSSAVSGNVTTSLEVERVIGSGPGNSNWGALFDVETSQSQANSRALASYHKIKKNSASRAKIWGLAISAINESTVDTMVVGAEINARAVGPMGANVDRIGAQFIVSTVENAAKSDFEAIINCVVNGTAGGGIEGTIGDLTADSKFGIKINEESPGKITNAGILVETTGTDGIRVGGGQSRAGVRVDSNTVYGVDLAGGTYSGAAMRISQGDSIAFSDDGNFEAGLGGTDFALRNKNDVNSSKYIFDMNRSAPTAPVINSYQGNAGATESVSSANPASFNGAIVQDTPEVSATYSLDSVFTISAKVKRARITWNFAETTNVAAAIAYKVSLNSPTTNWRLFGSPSISQKLDSGAVASGIITTILENTSGSDQTFELVRSANTSVNLTASGLANKNAATIEVLEWA